MSRHVQGGSVRGRSCPLRAPAGPRHFRALPVIVAVACGLIGGQAFGQSTFYYRGGTRTWSTGTNW